MRPIYDARIAYARQRQGLIAFAANAATEAHRRNASTHIGLYTVALMVATFAATLLAS